MSDNSVPWGPKCTTDGKPPVDLNAPAPNMETGPSGQHKSYWVLCEAERKKGFVRPVRQSYVHSRCGTTTHMGLALAETYAANPRFYGSTFCCACRDHYPVGEHGEFTWEGTTEKVGT